MDPSTAIVASDSSDKSKEKSSDQKVKLFRLVTLYLAEFNILLLICLSYLQLLDIKKASSKS